MCVRAYRGAHPIPPERPMKQSQEKLGRRTVLGGVAVVGAAAGAAALVPGRPTPQPPVDKTAQAATPSGDGYRLTEHIQRYYATARI